MNSHTCDSAVPPSNRAGPNERAGLTEVPVSGMPTRCTAVSARPMARPARAGVATFSVTSRMTRTNAAVSTASRTNAPGMLIAPLSYPFVPRAPVWSVTPKEDTNSLSIAPPRMAPANWATT